MNVLQFLMTRTWLSGRTIRSSQKQLQLLVRMIAADAKVSERLLIEHGIECEEAKTVARDQKKRGFKWLREVNRQGLEFAVIWGSASEPAVTEYQEKLAPLVASRLVSDGISLISGGGPGIMRLFDHAWQHEISTQGKPQVVTAALPLLLMSTEVTEIFSAVSPDSMIAPPQTSLDTRTALFLGSKRVRVVLVSSSGGLGTREEVARFMVAQQLHSQILTWLSGMDRIPYILLLDEKDEDLGVWKFDGLRIDWAMIDYHRAAARNDFYRAIILRCGDSAEEDQFNPQLRSYGPKVIYLDTPKQVAEMCWEYALK